MKHIVRNLVVAGTVAVSFGLSSGAAKAQEFINVLTGGTSGVYYPLGVALSEIYGQGIEGARTQVQATKASVENLNLLQAGRGEIGFTLGDSLKEGWAGNTEAGFPGKLDKLRGIAAIYPNYVQIVASKESGITKLEDLKGRSLSVGAPASGTELNARAIFAAAGLAYTDLGKLEYLHCGLLGGMRNIGNNTEAQKFRDRLFSEFRQAFFGIKSTADNRFSCPNRCYHANTASIHKIDS